MTTSAHVRPDAETDDRLNLVDQYLFAANHATVLVMNGNRSVAGSSSGSPFRPSSRYEFRILLDDDERESLTYRLTFSEPDQDGEQSYTVVRLEGAAAADDDAVGETVTTGRTHHTTKQGELAVWSGTARDPFFVDLSMLQSIVDAMARDEVVLADDLSPGYAVNSLAGATVSSIVLALPHTDPAVRPGRRLALWTTVREQVDRGGWRQASRQGIPLVALLLRPTSDAAGAVGDRTHPAEDRERFGRKIADRVAGVVRRHDTSHDPAGYGEAVAHTLTPDVLPYTVGTSASFGFAGMNGRTLTDNVAEAMFSLFTNRAIPTGLRPHGAATAGHAFPYVTPVSTSSEERSSR